MKKKLIVIVGIVVAAVVLGLGIYHSDASQMEPKLSEQEIQELLEIQYPGESIIKRIDNGIYEVEIIGDDNKQYALRLDGNTGEVLDLKETMQTKKGNAASNLAIKEKKNDAQEQKVKSAEPKKKQSTVSNENTDQSTNNIDKNQSNTNKTQSTHNTLIDVSEASKIALNQFSGKITDLELDEDDGRLIYEIEIEAGDREAEIEIDAITGEVLVIDIDD